MRKITSKSVQKKQEKRNQLIVGSILIFIMLGSTFGILANSFGTEDLQKKVKINGHIFLESNGFWITSIDQRTFALKTNPSEIKSLPGDLLSTSQFYGNPLYIYSENSDATEEIIRNFESIALRINFACPENFSCEENIPTKSCKDNFIIIQENLENKITQKQNCIFIEGKMKNLVENSDDFLLKFLEIKE